MTVEVVKPGDYPERCSGSGLLPRWRAATLLLSSSVINRTGNNVRTKRARLACGRAGWEMYTLAFRLRYHLSSKSPKEPLNKHRVRRNSG
jgi:hypothetical protein